MVVDKGLGFGYELGNIWVAELVPPPGQVLESITGWGVWEERTTVEGAEHVEVSMPCRYDQGSVE